MADVFEVPLAFFLDEKNHRIDSRVWRGRERRYYAMPYGERYIWGATAGMLKTCSSCCPLPIEAAGRKAAESCHAHRPPGPLLVLAPTVAFFLWAWAVKIKQQHKLAGTAVVAGPAGHLARHRRPLVHDRGFHRHVFTQNQGYGGLFAS